MKLKHKDHGELFVKNMLIFKIFIWLSLKFMKWKKIVNKFPEIPQQISELTSPGLVNQSLRNIPSWKAVTVGYMIILQVEAAEIAVGLAGDYGCSCASNWPYQTCWLKDLRNTCTVFFHARWTSDRTRWRSTYRAEMTM